MNKFSINQRKEVLVLFSGGIDSTACIYYYKQLGFHVQGLFIDYGQKSSKYERIAIKNLSKYYKIYTQLIRINSKLMIKNGEIQGRNIFLLSVALLNFPYSKGLISLGIHSGTNYFDCSPEFVEKSQEIFDLYSHGNITIDCPFIAMSKEEIFEFCNINKISIKDTYSCEYGSDVQPCGKCLTCKDLMKLYEIKDKNDQTPIWD
jgi:7-cyano-7-deazaguanine synthase